MNKWKYLKIEERNEKADGDSREEKTENIFSNGQLRLTRVKIWAKGAEKVRGRKNEEALEFLSLISYTCGLLTI